MCSTHRWQKQCWSQHLDDVSKVFPLNVVVCFDEDLSEDGLADGIVLGVELVEAVESVAILQKEWKLCDADVGLLSLHILNLPILYSRRACPVCRH